MNQDDFEVIVVDDKNNKPIDIIQEYESKIQHLRIALEEQNHSYLSILKILELHRLVGHSSCLWITMRIRRMIPC